MTKAEELQANSEFKIEFSDYKERGVPLTEFYNKWAGRGYKKGIVLTAIKLMGEDIKSLPVEPESENVEGEESFEGGELTLVASPGVPQKAAREKKPLISDMNEEEARAVWDASINAAGTAMDGLLQLNIRRGWKALGYDTFDALYKDWKAQVEESGMKAIPTATFYRARNVKLVEALCANANVGAKFSLTRSEPDGSTKKVFTDITSNQAQLLMTLPEDLIPVAKKRSEQIAKADKSEKGKISPHRQVLITHVQQAVNEVKAANGLDVDTPAATKSTGVHSTDTQDAQTAEDAPKAGSKANPFPHAVSMNGVAVDWDRGVILMNCRVSQPLGTGEFVLVSLPLSAIPKQANTTPVIIPDGAVIDVPSAEVTQAVEGEDTDEPGEDEDEDEEDTGDIYNEWEDEDQEK